MYHNCFHMQPHPQRAIPVLHLYTRYVSGYWLESNHPRPEPYWVGRMAWPGTGAAQTNCLVASRLPWFVDKIKLRSVIFHSLILFAASSSSFVEKCTSTILKTSVHKWWCPPQTAGFPFQKDSFDLELACGSPMHMPPSPSSPSRNAISATELHSRFSGAIISILRRSPCQVTRAPLRHKAPFFISTTLR